MTRTCEHYECLDDATHILTWQNVNMYSAQRTPVCAEHGEYLYRKLTDTPTKQCTYSVSLTEA